MAQLFTRTSLRSVLDERLGRLAACARSPRRPTKSASTDSVALGLTSVHVDWSGGVVVPATFVLVGPDREPHFRSMYAVPFTGSRELFFYRPDGLPDEAPAITGEVVNQTVVLSHSAPADGFRMRDDVRGWDGHQRMIAAVIGLTNRQLDRAHKQARLLAAGVRGAPDRRRRTDAEAFLRAG